MSFYLFVGAAAIAGLTTPLTNALNAIGKIKTTLLLMVMWTTLTWVLTVLFIYFFGYQGVALSIFLITFTIGIVVREMQKIVAFQFFAKYIFCRSGRSFSGSMVWRRVTVCAKYVCQPYRRRTYGCYTLCRVCMAY